MDKKEIAQLPYLNFDNSVEKIRAHFLNEKVKLLPKENEQKERYQVIFHLICNFKCNEEIITLLKNDYNLSTAQAYRDVKSTKEIFGDVVITKKEAARYVAMEMALKTFNLALTKKSGKKELPDLDQMNKANANYTKASGIDKDEIDLPDASKIQPPIQILQINIDFITSQFANIIDDKAKTKINQLLGQINNIIEKGRVNDYLDSAVEVPMITEKNAD